MNDKKYKYTISYKDDFQETEVSWNITDEFITYDELVDMFKYLSKGLGYHDETIKDKIKYNE